MTECPYKILKLNRNATAEEIKSAYRKLAMQYHPDRRPGDKRAESRFKQIQWAWEVLGNARRKAAYDATGSTEAVSEDREHSAMIGFLITVMHGALSNFGSTCFRENFDVVAEMHKSLQNALQNGNQHIAKLYADRKKLADAAGRFVVIEGSEENFLADACRAKVAELDAAVQGSEAELAKLGKAIAYLKKFGYRLDFGREQGVKTVTSMGVPHWILTDKKGSEY